MASVLIVDDAKFMRARLKELLEKSNHEIAGMAANGQEAIKQYKEIHPDLVMMDITMPVLNGIEALKAIVEYDPGATIIVCSAMGQQKVIVDAIEYGAKDFITKPFEKNRVLETVNQVLHAEISELSR